MPFRHVFWNIFPMESVIAAIVFGLVVAAMAAAVYMSLRKRRRGAPASRRDHLHAVEAIFGVALAGMAAFLTFAAFSANARDFPDTSPKPTVRVLVTAFQWCWRFQYADSPVTVNGSCANGQYPVLEVPAGEPVRFDVASVDVLHAFWVPYLDNKVDAFPGHTTTFTTTVTQTGRWLGRCAQYCGLYHSTMDFWLQAVPPKQFRDWLSAQMSTSAGAAR